MLIWTLSTFCRIYYTFSSTVHTLPVLLVLSIFSGKILDNSGRYLVMSSFEQIKLGSPHAPAFVFSFL